MAQAPRTADGWPGTVVSQGPQPGGLPTTPQPFPGGAAKNYPRAASRQQDMDNADIRIRLAQQQAALAQQEAQRQQESHGQTVKKNEVEIKTDEANGGVKTISTQDQAAFHATNLLSNLGAIRRLGSQGDQRAFKPGGLETIMKTMSDNPDAISWAQSDTRRAADAAYTSMLDSVIWLSTGAAAPPDQVQRIRAGITPAYFDDPQTLADKRARLLGYITAARAWAGPADLKVQKSLDELEKASGDLYSPQGTLSPQDTGPKRFSNTNKLDPLPAEMQTKHANFMNSFKPGELTVEQYKLFRSGLQHDFGYSTDITTEDAKKYVDAFNSGKNISTHIPDPNREMNFFEKGKSYLFNNPVGTAAAHFGDAMGAGIPSAVSPSVKASLDYAKEENPKAALIGEVAGSISPTSAAEKTAARMLEHTAMDKGRKELASSILGNAAYGGVSGAAHAPEGSGVEGALLGATAGGGGALGGTMLVKGARGLVGDGTRQALESLDSAKFDLAPERGILPVDEITPLRFQHMTDAELQAELVKARQGLQSVEAHKGTVEAVGYQKAQLEREAQATAVANRQKGALAQKERIRSTMVPEHADAVRAEIAKEFPTDPEVIKQSPDFQKKAAKLQEPSADGLENPAVLQERTARLEAHLAEDPTVKQGTIPATDLTTAMRMGQGGTEEALGGLPFVHGMRENVVESWNKQRVAKILAKVGVPLPKELAAGHDALNFLHDSLTSAYEKVSPAIKGYVDQPYDNAVAGLRVSASKESPKHLELWGEIQDAIHSFKKSDGTFDWDSYSAANTKLRRLSELWKANTSAETLAFGDMAQVADTARRQIRELVSRNNPKAGAQLKKLDEAYAMSVRAEKAARGTAKSTRGVASPDEYLNAIEQLDTSPRKAAVSRGKALDQADANNARDIIGGKPAKKTSLTQTALGVSGLTYFAPLPVKVAGGALVLGGYTPGVKRIVQALIDGKVGRNADAISQLIKDSKLAKSDIPVLSSLARKAGDSVSSEGLRQLTAQVIRQHYQQPHKDK